MDINNQLLTIQQAALLLGVSPGTLRRWAQDKKVKGLKVGSRGDWRFRKDEVQKLIKEYDKVKPPENKYQLISNFLIANASSIQKLATQLHKKFLGGTKFRTESIDAYQKMHNFVVKEFARNLKPTKMNKGVALFNDIGETVAKAAIEDRLTLQETVDGLIFLHQAIWEKLRKHGILKEFTAEEMYEINQLIGTYSDVLASKVAFAYHRYYEQAVVGQYRASVIIELSEDAIISKNLNGIITSWNKSAERMFGYTADEAIGQSITMVIPQELHYEEKDIVSKIRKGIRIQHYETTRVRKDGTRLILSLSISPIKDITGTIIGATKIARDITEKKQAEEEIKRSKAQIEAVFEAIRDGIVVTDMEGNVILVNRAQALINGFKDIEEMKTKIIEYRELYSFWDLNGKRVPYKDWPLNRILRGESIVNLSLKARRNDIGKEWYFSFSGEPVIKENNVQIMGVLISRDVTDEKENEERFRTLADNIPNLAWMADADGMVFWYNSRWYEYTGTTPDQMRGRGWEEVHDPDVLPRVIEHWKKSLANGEPFEMVIPMKGADGVFRPFLTRIFPVKDQNGRIARWFGTSTDITKQKELEKQKDEFLGIASHELKTPVTSIKAYGQVLQSMFIKKGDIKAAQHLGKMDAQVNKLTNLIEDLLDVTKIQAGRLEFQEEFFDFNELVDEIVEELQRTTTKHSLIKKLTKSRTIHGDRERIGQVLTNLLTNAIKYSPHSNEIIVFTEVNHKTIKLCVQDFGIGISKEKQDRVFEQFFRVSGDKEITFPGLGLGLYVASEIIKRQGGKIWVNSVVNKGSTFCFSLPINQKVVNKNRH